MAVRWYLSPPCDPFAPFSFVCWSQVNKGERGRATREGGEGGVVNQAPCVAGEAGTLSGGGGVFPDFGAQSKQVSFFLCDAQTTPALNYYLWWKLANATNGGLRSGIVYQFSCVSLSWISCMMQVRYSNIGKAQGCRLVIRLRAKAPNYRELAYRNWMYQR